MSTLFPHFLSKFNQISPLETKFTEVLDAIALKPKILYFYGKMPENGDRRPKTVAIVGSRRNTRYGEEVAYKLGYELARHGVVVVSGLAYGIDSIAHRAALDAGGITVAVLGTPIDQIQPSAHMDLAREIIEKGGAVMSEYAPNARILPKVSFLERNRLISGLSDIVIVVEAARRSGALNTAMHALDQNKELLVVPGNITSPLSEGCNRLIKQGANPCTSAEDVLELLGGKPMLIQKTIFGDTKEEVQILKTIKNGIAAGEEIVKALKMPAAIFSQTITMLEIKGAVRSLGANHWALR